MESHTWVFQLTHVTSEWLDAGGRQLQKNWGAGRFQLSTFMQVYTSLKKEVKSIKHVEQFSNNTVRGRWEQARRGTS